MAMLPHGDFAHKKLQLKVTAWHVLFSEQCNPTFRSWHPGCQKQICTPAAAMTSPQANG
jgi:hypothetical protein